MKAVKKAIKDVTLKEMYIFVFVCAINRFIYFFKDTLSYFDFDFDFYNFGEIVIFQIPIYIILIIAQVGLNLVGFVLEYVFLPVMIICYSLFWSVAIYFLWKKKKKEEPYAEIKIYKFKGE